jgi:hypothetical protein
MKSKHQRRGCAKNNSTSTLFANFLTLELSHFANFLTFLTDLTRAPRHWSWLLTEVALHGILVDILAESSDFY